MKAQVSMEFVVMVGLASFALLFVLINIYHETGEIRQAREDEAIEDLGRYLQNEISIASRVTDGYTRILELPAQKDGIEYQIENRNNISITLISEERERTFWVPAYIGNFTKGQNKIDRLSGIVYVNVI